MALVTMRGTMHVALEGLRLVTARRALYVILGVLYLLMSWSVRDRAYQTIDVLKSKTDDESLLIEAQRQRIRVLEDALQLQASTERNQTIVTVPAAVPCSVEEPQLLPQAPPPPPNLALRRRKGRPDDGQQYSARARTRR
jgi:hypothetical protein